MVVKIETVAKIIQVGNSLGITIDKDVKHILKLKKGDYIKISVEKIDVSEDPEKDN